MYTFWDRNSRDDDQRLDFQQPSVPQQHTVASYGQVGGVTAHTVNMSPPARNLNHADSQSFREMLLKIDRSEEWFVMSQFGDAEGRALAFQIVAFMRAKNTRSFWSTRPGYLGGPGQLYT